MLDIRNLHPLIVPRSYIEGTDWDLPHVSLPNQQFILTWVEYREAMVYLDRATYNELEASGREWQRQSFDNVRQAAPFCQHQKENESGKVEWIAFVNDEDTISSSKVLLQPELHLLFPEGYRVAIPDRACGLVISDHCVGEALAQVKQLVENMYAGATTPMVPDLYPAADFGLPTAWLSLK